MKKSGFLSEQSQLDLQVMLDPKAKFNNVIQKKINLILR